MVTLFFKVILRFEGEKKAGLGLRRRILPVFWHPAAPPPAEIAINSGAYRVPDTSAKVTVTDYAILAS